MLSILEHRLGLKEVAECTTGGVVASTNGAGSNITTGNLSHECINMVVMHHGDVLFWVNQAAHECRFHTGVPGMTV